MGLDNKTLAAAKSYVKQSLQGAGAVKGQKGEPGKDGISPTVTATPISSGHKITITDKNSTQSFDVMDGNVDIASGTIGMFTLANDVNIQKDSVINVQKSQIVGHTPIKYPGQIYDIYAAIIWQGKEIYFSSFIIQKETGDANQYYEIKLMDNPKKLTGVNETDSNIADGFMIFGKLGGVPAIDEEMNLPSSYFIGKKPAVDTIVAKHGIVKVDDKVYFIRYKVLETDDSVSKIKYVEEPILLNNETSSNELVTITDTEVTNISQLPDEHCCIHAIRSTIGFQFVDDIIYVQKDDDVVRVYTIDGSILTINVNSTGALSVSGDSLDYFVKESDLKSAYYNKSQVDEKISGITSTPGLVGLTFDANVDTPPTIGSNTISLLGFNRTPTTADSVVGGYFRCNGIIYYGFGTIGNITTDNCVVHLTEINKLTGDDGKTPAINPANKHWMIGDTDTGVVAESEDGRSIQSVTKDENDNIIVTFSDGTTQNIGKLSIDISADFLTENGFGNIRYYNGKFQAYKNDEWIDIAATPENTIVINMMPNPMQHIMGVYDYKEMHYKLKWTEPKDAVVDGQVICLVENIVIRRKLGSTPENENDGDLVMIVPRKDFGIHKDTWYIDETVSPSVGDIYYYKAFPMSTTGFYNTSSQNETGSIEARDYYLYGFTLDQNESDPDSMISYIEDNKKFRPAYMNYSTDSFYYGDWRNSDVFFMDFKPCMLKYDGTVDYYLNPDDYGLKEDGTPSDNADATYGGNAMVEFPKIYWKIMDNGDDTANIYISDKKLDDGFHCWSHIDNNGNEIDYCYMPIYNGTYHPIDGTTKNRLRSISKQTSLSCHHASGEIEEALANNLNNETIWYTEVYSDRVLINLLILLIGKSTNTREKFGYGHYSSGDKQSDIFMPGYHMDKKGLFWGSNDTWKPMKIFGMENWWGNQWRRIAGWINDNGTQKVKMTYGQSDGSTVDGYNLDGSGYIEITDSTITGLQNGCISKMIFTENGLIPKAANGTATTYYADWLWIDITTAYALVGGCSANKILVGMFSTSLTSPASTALFPVGASVSCKPLAN